MRNRHTCPKCSGGELFVVDPWCQPNPRTSNTTFATQVVFNLSPVQRHVGAEVELWICGACGYSEMYAKGAQNLGQLVDRGVEGIRRVVRSGDEGAYR